MKDIISEIDINDEDIKWIKSIMPDLDFDECRIDILKNMASVDIHACPGSGKTTLLVAKLAILANKWPYLNKGICVLSHTNVAREEIQERLGKLNVGKKLLSYPHFIGTFQSFMDAFIAMPMLRSCNYPVNIIDTDYVIELRWNHLYTKKWLINKGKDKKVCDPSGLPYQFPVKCGIETPTYKGLIKVVSDSRKRGEFTFNEMELYSLLSVEKKPVVKEIMKCRFPILFIDEAQDTKSDIWNLINLLYDGHEQDIIYQAYGDSNQAIFDSYEKMDESKHFPRANALEMLNSKRFVPEIAHLANAVALDKRQMAGEYTGFTKKIRNTIFLFDKNAEENVLVSFVNLIFDSFSDEELENNKKYGCHVLGMVHKLGDEKSEKDFAARLSDYYPVYNPETRKTVPATLIDYFYTAEEQINRTGEVSSKVEWIAKGIYKLMKKYPAIDLSYSTNAFNSIIKTVENEDKVKIRTELWHLTNMKFQSPQEWKIIVDTLFDMFSKYIKCRDARDDSFVQWYGPRTNNCGDDVSNVKKYESDDGRSVELNFGSIHSSKGRTHLATLVVETKYHEYNLTSILPWLCGKSAKLGKRNISRLKCQYVAMTRAKGLLCLALPRENVPEEIQKDLTDFGWNIVFVKDSK